MNQEPSTWRVSLPRYGTYRKTQRQSGRQVYHASRYVIQYPRWSSLSAICRRDDVTTMARDWQRPVLGSGSVFTNRRTQRLGKARRGVGCVQ